MKTIYPQVFLLHFAGGNAYSYQFLKQHFPVGIDYQSIELPGRGRRIGQSRITRKDLAVDDLVKQIIELRNGEPYVLFGHSMGALLGLDVCREMEKLKDAPIRFIASGSAGPKTGENKHRYLMSKDQLKQELRALGGIPEEVLQSAELYDFFEPIIRSDFEIIEAKSNWENEIERIDTNITCLMGSNEETVNEIENWKEYTSGEFSSSLYEGNHFFIYDHPREISSLIKKCYDSVEVHENK